MTHEELAIVQILIGILTGGVAVAVINWLATRGKTKAVTNIDIQTYWHTEFKRLEARIEELETDKKGQDVTIAELEKEVATYKQKYVESKDEIARLTTRIRELERLIRKYNIDPDCGDKK
jgi:uncharacterized coiled-coil protein SlyX